MNENEILEELANVYFNIYQDDYDKNECSEYDVEEAKIWAQGVWSEFATLLDGCSKAQLNAWIDNLWVYAGYNPTDKEIADDMGYNINDIYIFRDASVFGAVACEPMFRSTWESLA